MKIKNSKKSCYLINQWKITFQIFPIFSIIMIDFTSNKQYIKYICRPSKRHTVWSRNVFEKTKTDSNFEIFFNRYCLLPIEPHWFQNVLRTITYYERVTIFIWFWSTFGCGRFGFVESMSCGRWYSISSGGLKSR